MSDRSDDPVGGEILERINLNVRLVQDQAHALLGRHLELNRDAVVWLDGFISRRRDANADVDGLVNVPGCYYGACIQNTFGGEWRYIEDQLAIRFSVGSAAFPLVHVAKHFENDDDSDVLSGKFDAIGNLIKAGTIKVDKFGATLQ
jgi:hypothetical protein